MRTPKMNEHLEESIGDDNGDLSQEERDVISASVNNSWTYHKLVPSRDDFTRSTSPLIQGLSTQLSTQSLAQDPERPATLRQLPIRAVFDDLQTAHNLITTGSARNATGFCYRTSSSNAPSFNGEESSITLQELDPEDDSSSDLLPVRPSPAAISTSCHGSIPVDFESGCIRPGSWLAQTPGIIDSLDHAAAIALLPISCTDHALPRTLRPSGTFDSVDSVSPPEFCSQVPAMDSPDAKATQGVNNSSYYHSGFGAPPSDTLPPDFPRYAHANSFAYYPPHANDGSSLRDGSTVGNIYKHYVGSEDYDGQSEASAEGQELPSYKPLSKQANHRLNVQQVPTNNFQGVSHASSYGDTRKLLEITKGSKTAQIQIPTFARNGNQINHNGPSSIIDSVPAHGKGPEKTNNRNVQGLHVVVYPASDENSAHGDRPVTQAGAQARVPLEKEVSRALRRASGYSAYSVGSISTAPHDLYNDPPSEASTYKAIKSLLRRNVEITSSPGMGSLENNTNYAGHQAQGFYDERAIASNHISKKQRNMVRVPVNQLTLPDSPPYSPACQVTPFSREDAGPSDDPNDWETVGESALGQPIPDFLGGTVRQAGSSIANLSDEDIRELRSFSSTDRIAQHPGNIEYSGDYRQRDLKKSHIPIFLPVFKEHKVNGYLADSNRIRPPPNQFYKTPPSLQSMHENPFQSPPPKLPSQRHRNTNRFPLGYFLNPHQGSVVVDSKYHSGKAKAHVAQGSFQNPNWMDEYGEPGPVLTNQVLRATAPEYSNAGNLVLPFDSEYRRSQDHRIFNSSSDHDSKILEWRTREKHQTDGSVELKTYCSNSNTKSQRERRPFVKGPPGAFYRGLRAVSTGEGKGARENTQRERAPTRTVNRKASVNDLPTNTLRPLSLLADLRPRTPTDQFTPSPNESMGNDFVYRSPLAPPLRSSWQELYSKGQMNEIREAAKADGYFSSRSSIPGIVRQPGKNTSAQKRLFEVPRLAAFSRHSSNQTGLIHQKKKVSIVILCLCALFPPLLLLYAIGALDSLMSWWTSGQCSTCGKTQKKVALIMVWIWGLILFLMLAAFLVVWFVVLHRG